MRFNKLDLNLLVVLDSLLTTRSVSRTAERLFLSQPATSLSLSRLRAYFEDDLLVAVGKTQVLTPLAADMIKPVRDVLLRDRAPSFATLALHALVSVFVGWLGHAWFTRTRRGFADVL